MTVVTKAVDSAISFSKANNFTSDQQKLIDATTEPKDKARLVAQLTMQNRQESVAMITNLLKKGNEIAMAVINNMR